MAEASVYYSRLLFVKDIYYTFCIENASSETLQADISRNQHKHKQGKTNDDVIGVYIYDSPKFEKLPAITLKETFKNIKVLSLGSTGLKEISMNELIGLEKLIELQIENNKNLISLPGDLFKNMPDLQCISFKNNKIKFIGKDLLKPLTEIKFIDLRGNETINAYHGTYKFWTGPGISLEELNIMISKQCRPKCQATSCVVEMHRFWKEGLFSDFMIHVKDVEFKVHRCILGIASPVFAAMFSHEDVQENKENQMAIIDFSAEAVREFLCFIYTKAAPENAANAMELYAMAAKYEVSSLLSITEDLILDSINNENAYEVLVFGNLHNNDYLKDDAFKEIKKLFTDVELSEGLKDRPDDLKLLIDAQRKMNGDMAASRAKFQQTLDDVNK